MATARSRKQLTARERAANALAEHHKWSVIAAAEDIEGVLQRTNIVAEYNKLRKDDAGNEIADYAILAALAKLVGAKGVEITKKKAPTRRRPDSNAPRRKRSPAKPKVDA
ncbi:MAG: hypothetical protein EBU08_07785 [Micrococcales bacterium]|nr:hypothetical protein [Micrococcales bacterium]